MQGQKALRFHQTYLNLCSEDKLRFYGFGTTWEWVINDRIYIFGWTIPLRLFWNRDRFGNLSQTFWQRKKHLLSYGRAFFFILSWVCLYKTCWHSSCWQEVAKWLLMCSESLLAHCFVVAKGLFFVYHYRCVPFNHKCPTKYCAILCKIPIWRERTCLVWRALRTA